MSKAMRGRAGIPTRIGKADILSRNFRVGRRAAQDRRNFRTPCAAWTYDDTRDAAQPAAASSPNKVSRAQTVAAQALVPDLVQLFLPLVDKRSQSAIMAVGKGNEQTRVEREKGRLRSSINHMSCCPCSCSLPLAQHLQLMRGRVMCTLPTPQRLCRQRVTATLPMCNSGEKTRRRCALRRDEG